MSKKYSPRKKYAQGTSAKGMDPNHYIISPAEALNDYNIMLAKAEERASTDPWLPVVAIAGQALQTGIGIAGQYNTDRFNTPKKAAMGNNNVNKDVEVEGGEMFETPQGQVGEFKGPSHEQGGIPLEVGQDVQEGTKVYSDRLKVGNKTLAERKATRERQVANLEKIASNNLADQAVKNAAKRKMMAIEKEEAADLDFQEKVNNMQKMADTMVEAFAYGTSMSGIQKYPDGTGPQGILPGFGLKAKGIAKGIKGIPDDEDTYYTPEDFKVGYNYWQAKLQESEGDKYRKRDLSNLDDRKEFQNFLYKDNSLLGKKGVEGDRNYDYTIDGVLGNTAHFANNTFMLNGEARDMGNYINSVTGEYLPNTQEALKNKVPVTLANNPNLNFDALKNFGPPEGINDNASTSYADPSLVDGVPPETIMTPVTAYGQGVDEETVATAVGKKEPSKFMKALEGNMPAVGDVTKLIGNYLGMTSGIKTAAEQRSTDITHTNTFANAGEESQRLLDNAKQGIETSKAQAIVKATSVGRGGKKGARGSARGVNQMRAMDWLYDTALNQQIAEISANAAGQLSQIDVQKSGVAMNADQLKGQGEYQANMANEAAKDAYYTALGLGKKDFATGLQQTGEDLNDRKKNKVASNIVKGSGIYTTIDDKGNIGEKTFEIKGSDGKMRTVTFSEMQKLMSEMSKKSSK